jgi:uncharacterized protein (TIGR00288 family)
MISAQENVSMALFCDFENVALGVRDANYEKFDIRLVLERLLLKGSIVVKKAYCDWERYKAFKAAMHEANFELIEIPHVRQSGKNSADIRLVVDALDLCYTKSHVDTFVIISGDSDFSPLVSKLRENAKHVIGVGVKQSTSDLLIANCDEFIFYDDLVRENARSTSRRAATRDTASGGRRAPDDEKRRKEDSEARRTQAVDMAVETFEALVAERGDSGKIWASVLKEAIKRRKPDFNESYYGFRAFGNLLEEAQSRGLLDFSRDEKSGTYVYRAQAGANSTGGDSTTAGNGAIGNAAVNNPGRGDSGAGKGRNGHAGSGNRKPRQSEDAAPGDTESPGHAAQQAASPAGEPPEAATPSGAPTTPRRRASRGRGARSGQDTRTQAVTAEPAHEPLGAQATAPEAAIADTAIPPSTDAPAPANDAPPSRRRRTRASASVPAPVPAAPAETPAAVETAPQPKAPRKSPARPRRARKTAAPAAES